jgi:3-oxochol-4-en-24-oyl-CoA dehydrogenase
VPIATTSDQFALQASLRDWAKQAAPLAAAALVLDDAVENAKDCIQVLGGIGFTWEHDAHPAIRKLIGAGHRQAVAETALERLGPDGAAESGASGEFLLTRCLSIAGGTTQILLNQVGERVLGLPR